MIDPSRQLYVRLVHAVSKEVWVYILSCTNSTIPTTPFWVSRSEFTIIYETLQGLEVEELFKSPMPIIKYGVFWYIVLGAQTPGHGALARFVPLFYLLHITNLAQSMLID
jgi:hypothetical protein